MEWYNYNVDWGSGYFFDLLGISVDILYDMGVWLLEGICFGVVVYV